MKAIFNRTVWLLIGLTPALLPGAEDILIADFEGPDYGAWTTAGEAFGSGPAQGTLPNQMKVEGFQGRGLANSYWHGDDTTGTLTSPHFLIQRSFINFLIGGGMYPGETCINLLVDGQVVRSATGPNDRPGGSERLDWHSWDVGDLKDREAVIQIVDQRKGGWGHINIDHIVQSERKRQAGPAQRIIQIDRSYLHLPVRNGAPMVRMKVSVAQAVVDEFDIELAPDQPDFWVFLDWSRFRGQSATISVNRLPDDSQGLANLKQADQVPGADLLYGERYRPQFHFSSRRGWNNDPNGLVYYEGEYHLYYQHNPYGWNWGNMHWGHAVSTDLVHWQELPIAIYPQRYGDWVFSGGAVVDRNNTGGFKTGAEDVIVASYTSTGRGEAIAYSNDRGRTFTDYPGNPVIKHAGRDPKIIWYAPGRHWVMAVYDEHDQGRYIAFHTSADLKAWTFQSRIEGYFECPEIFELPIDEDKHRTRWVVYAADGAYAVGSFDGKVFTPDHPSKHPFNWGNCFYASQTYSDIPPSDGRRIQIAWGRIGHPSMPFNQIMNLPVQLTLRATEEGPRLFAWPVREIETLRTRSRAWRNRPLQPGDNNPLAGLQGELWDLEADLAPAEAKEVGFRVRGVQVIYHPETQTLSCGDKNAPLPMREGRIQLRLLVDRLSVEIYGNRGERYMPMGVVVDPENRSLEVYAKGGPAQLHSLAAWELQSAWLKPRPARAP